MKRLKRGGNENIFTKSTGNELGKNLCHWLEKETNNRFHVSGLTTATGAE